jgi:hypothetical protein
MITRILKEFHHIRYGFYFCILISCIFWLCTNSLYTGYRFGLLNIPNFLHLLIVHIMAVQPFGNEFNHKTVERMLSFPLYRMTIWRDKFLTLFTVLTIICIMKWVNHYLVYLEALEIRDFYLLDHEPIPVLYCGYISGIILSLFFGPLFSIYFKKSLIAFWASALGVFSFYILFIPIAETIDKSSYYKEICNSFVQYPIVQPIYHTIGDGLAILIYLIPWCILAFWLSRRMWKKLEV